MPSRKGRHIHNACLIVACLWLSILLPQATLAAEAGWDTVPDALKSDEGIAIQGEVFYSTGRAEPQVISREAKAHEFARKKSLLRALQLVYMAISCRNLIETLPPDEQKPFESVLLPLLDPIELKGVTVIRQWEDGHAHFITIAAPLKAVQDLPCEFQDLTSVISRYMDLQSVTSEGLKFCFRHVPRYSNLNHEIIERLGRWYEDRGMKSLALCFLPSPKNQNDNPVLEPFVLQNRLLQANRLTAHAANLASQSRWKDAVPLVSQALDLAHRYSQAYLVLADYFLCEEKDPIMALYAADKGLRDGTCLKEALTKVVASLKALQSPEAEIYDFLLTYLGIEGAQPEEMLFPKAWQQALDSLKDVSAPYMVMMSLGRVLEGASKRPDPLYFQAEKLFTQVKEAHELAQVVQLLMQASEKQPLSPETYNLIGACFRHVDKVSLALPFLWQALRLKPEYDYALVNLGLCCEKLGLMKAAAFYFEQPAVKESPSTWVQESYARFHENAEQKKPAGAGSVHK